MPEDTHVLADLMTRGARVPHPASVFVSPEVDPERIDGDVTLHPGTRLLGASLSIGPGSVIGGETPATVKDCQLGRDVSLKGGYFEGSVFLDGGNVGSAAHVRPGCLLEEEVSVAHAVGLKQTILFPFVTLGSLINFCDVWMSGGTSRKDHSEVGSSFIHFNFTPHADKATASLIGDPAAGMLLDRPPVFLGGQGGVVGPVEMAHGVVQAAGSVCRRDLDAPDHLYQSAVPGERWAPYTPGRIRDPDHRIRKNLRYIGSLVALRAWYTEFRPRVMDDSPATRHCLSGARKLLAGSARERVKQLNKLLGLIEGGGNLPERVDAAVAEEVDGGGLRELAERVAPGFPGYPGGMRGLAPEDGARVVSFFQSQQHRFASLADH